MPVKHLLVISCTVALSAPAPLRATDEAVGDARSIQGEWRVTHQWARAICRPAGRRTRPARAASWSGRSVPGWRRPAAGVTCAPRATRCTPSRSGTRNRAAEVEGPGLPKGSP
jgi:hypothetical protein